MIILKFVRNLALITMVASVVFGLSMLLANGIMYYPILTCWGLLLCFTLFITWVTQ